ncbi:hypothetical protein HK100_000432, partial [Physocladia obscura]
SFSNTARFGPILNSPLLHDGNDVDENEEEEEYIEDEEQEQEQEQNSAITRISQSKTSTSTVTASIISTATKPHSKSRKHLLVPPGALSINRATAIRSRATTAATTITTATTTSTSYKNSSSYSTTAKKTHVRLANTAVGLREIAKKIGKRTLQWESPPKTLLIVTKIHDSELVPFTKDLAMLVEERLREYPEFAAFSDVEEYNIISEYGRSPSIPINVPTMQKTVSATFNKNSSSINPDSNTILFWSPDDFLKPLASDPLSSKIDLIVTLGGDGTVLFTASLFESVKVPPIVPFDLGSLGFLAVFEFESAKDSLRRILNIPDPEPLMPPETAQEHLLHLLGTKNSSTDSLPAFNNNSSLELNAIQSQLPTPTINHYQNQQISVINSSSSSNLLSGGYNSPPTTNGTRTQLDTHPRTSGFNVNMRLRLACRIYRISDVATGTFSADVETHHVLNEMVVDRGPSAYMSHLELFVDGSYLTTSMADGLVVATPTGSTAYSLSAGGSIVHPLVPALLVTPICPHTLSFRPMLLPESIELTVQIPLDARGSAWVSFDGKMRCELRQGDEVRIEVSKFGVPTVCRQDQIG